MGAYKRAAIVAIIFIPSALASGLTFATCDRSYREREKRQEADEACIARGGVPARWGDCYLKCEKER